MSLLHTKRMKEVEHQMLLQVEEKIAKLKQFLEDYRSLEICLHSLPEKLSHDVMVPFGNLAFMPGRLVHTNEILVLLGDNWFVERSAKQSIDIVERHIAGLHSQIEAFEKQKSLIEPRISFAEELIAQDNSDVVEITEPYDEESEKSWQELHKKNVEKYRHEWSKEPGDRDIAVSDSVADWKLWQRLDELEQEEADNDELRSEQLCDSAATELMPSPITSNDSASLFPVTNNADTKLSGEARRPSSSKSVRWDDRLLEECSSEEEFSSLAVINFKHSEADYQPMKSVPEELATPADIYAKFTQPLHTEVPKSILKNTSVTEDESRLVERVASVSVSEAEAVSSTVTERNPSAAAAVSVCDPVSSVVVERNQSDSTVTDCSSVQPSVTVPKKISKFKSSRMHSAT